MPLLTLDRFELTDTGAEVRELRDLSSDLTWIPAVVSGGVHESLLAVGRIPHPYENENESEIRWVDDRTWWYRTTFDGVAAAADERLRLVFPSLDTVVTIWLNGALLGTHVNAFREAAFEVQLLESNELVLRFAPPLEDLEAPVGAQLTVDLMKAFFASQMPADDVPEEAPGVLSANLALTRRRKPTFSWGWDFGPRLPSVGVLAPVELHLDKAAVLVGHHVRTLHVDVEKRTAQVAIDVEVDAFSYQGPLTATVSLAGRSVDLPLPASVGSARRASVVLALADVDLWWTHDLGTPTLHDVAITVLDVTTTTRVGLRTVELDRPADEVQPGRLFRFLLNGVPTYSRGANWVPPSLMRGSVTPSTIRRMVDLARRGDMTMLRIWGGGAYEQDTFYDACDELGLLVWQDFMFACIDYPSEELALQDEVAREAEYQVRRLRNHASLALWCGNNEVHGIHRAVYATTEPDDWGWHFFHGLLPDAVQRLSPGTVYWPGSPWADSDPRGGNGIHDGDRHAWEVWHGMEIGAGGPTEFASRGEQVHFSRYAHDNGRFISEFGIHASPELDTLRRWTTSELQLGSPAFLHRNKDMPKDKGNDLMEYETGLPSDLGQYVDHSMACQAEGLKFGVEHYRRRQPHNSGTLVWQLNDVWPGMSWSVIDSDLVAKAGYYFLQRAYRTVIASFRRTADGLELWVTNSGRTTVELELAIDVSTFEGARAADVVVPVVSEPASSKVVWSTSAVPTDGFSWVSDTGGLITPNRAFFSPVKGLPLGKGELDVAFERGSGGTARVQLTSRGYTYFARLTASVPGPLFSTNYLDLRDGQSVTIDVAGLPDGFDAGQLQLASWGPRHLGEIGSL